jgi:hypothetical protein
MLRAGLIESVDKLDGLLARGDIGDIIGPVKSSQVSASVARSPSTSRPIDMFLYLS